MKNTHPESQAERLAFEAKCLEAGHNFSKIRRGDSYDEPWQDAWWRVWKASAEHQRAAQSPVVAPETVPMIDKENAVQQAQIWHMEAKTQRGIVLSILRHFGLPERDYEALGLVKALPPSTPAVPGWISVNERLPEVEQLVMVYSPPTQYDHPGEENITFDCIDPNDDERASWLNHNENYEHFCCVAKPEGSVGPSEKAPYTHWMHIPAAPQPPKEAA